MQIIKSSLFQNYDNIIFGFSTKIGLNRTEPFYFNLSFTVGDKPETVQENREAFYNEIGIRSDQIAIQKQIHSDIVTIVDEPGVIGESDAMITTKKGIGLAVSSADCIPIFIYDKKKKVIAAVHSGWRGTQKQILKKTLGKLRKDFNSRADDLLVYIGPSISQKNYEVGEEVAIGFNSKYVKKNSGKFYLDLISANLDMLFDSGISDSNLEISNLCSYDEKYLHSYRRDGKKSGRALGVIAMKGN